MPAQWILQCSTTAPTGTLRFGLANPVCVVPEPGRAFVSQGVVVSVSEYRAIRQVVQSYLDHTMAGTIGPEQSAQWVLFCDNAAVGTSAVLSTGGTAAKCTTPDGAGSPVLTKGVVLSSIEYAQIVETVQYYSDQKMSEPTVSTQTLLLAVAVVICFVLGWVAGQQR